MILTLKYGEVEIELYPEKAPNHVKRFKKFSDEGRYDNVVFHRVIDGFMAQTGDVKFGNTSSSDFNLNLAGTFAIASACFIVIDPATTLPGSFDPLFNFVASLIKCEAGGDLITKSNFLSL